MASTEPVKVDKKQEVQAQLLWENFGGASKWATIGIILILVALAVITL